MADTISAPAAPVAPASNANSSQAPAGAATPKTSGSVVPGQQSRNPDGKFLPQHDSLRQTPADAATPPADATPAEKQAYRFKNTIKLNHMGKTIEEAVDLDETQIHRALQKGRYYELQAPLIARADNIIKALRSNPAEALRALEIDPEEFARSQLSEAMRRQTMTPEERQASEAQEEAQGLRQQVEELRAREQRAAFEQQTQAAGQQWRAHFETALSAAGEPQSYQAIEEMAMLQLAAMEQDGFEMTPEQLAQEYINSKKAKVNSHLGSLVEAFSGGQLTPEAFISSLPPELVRAVHSAARTIYERKQIPGTGQRSQQVPEFKQENRQFLTEAELADRARALRGLK